MYNVSITFIINFVIEKIFRSNIADNLILNFYCPSFSDSPILFLKIGPSLNPENIKEGDDVYFECYIRSNPKVHKFDWFHNVRNNLNFIHDTF